MCERPKRVFPYHIWLPYGKYTRYYEVQKIRSENSIQVYLFWRLVFIFCFKILDNICLEFFGWFLFGLHNFTDRFASDELYEIYSAAIRCYRR